MAEAQRTLVENGLRNRVTMRVDGGIRTGHDVVMAALLGGEVTAHSVAWSGERWGAQKLTLHSRPR